MTIAMRKKPHAIGYTKPEEENNMQKEKTNEIPEEVVEETIELPQDNEEDDNEENNE